MPTLKKKLQGKVKMPKDQKPLKPLWQGPSVEGVTQSLLSRYVTCRERFRIRTILGLTSVKGFNSRTHYGDLWHICEEAHAAKRDWNKELYEAAQRLAQTYYANGSDIDKWYNVCKVQFPLYVKWWRDHPDVKKREPLYQEYEFKLKYELKSGRHVFLRGKMDSVDRINKCLWLQENKTKGDIDPAMMQRQLQFDLQTMVYLTVLHELLPKEKLAGVRYNVIRRPLSGGRGSIRQHQPTKNNPNGESNAEYYARLEETIANAIEPDGSHYFFMRWNVEINLEDIERFRKEFLDPVLENMLDDYEWWEYCYGKHMNVYDYSYREMMFPHHASRHWRLPFGIYNPLAEGGSTELDEYLLNGNEEGLERSINLFPELTCQP